MNLTCSRRSVWKEFGYWAVLNGILFLTLYPLCNRFTAQRSHVFHLYFKSELSILFIPQFIWGYLSLYLLFFLPPLFLNESQLAKLGKELIAGTLISGLFFLLLPATLGFERIVPDGIYGSLFRRIFSLDLPYNMAPSLHVVYSGFILLSIFQATSNILVKIWMTLWLVIVSVSILFVHQHHLFDLFLGMAIVFLLNHNIRGNRNV